MSSGPDAWVRFDGGTITETGTTPAPGDAVDLGDVTILPGLIDAHVHLAFDASDDPVGRLSQVDDDELLESMKAAARRALRAGITVVRDLGDRSYLAVRLKGVLPDGPEILAAGPPITVTRGHCWYLGGEADGVEGVRAAVRAHAERGVDVIKVMATGGELTAGTHGANPSYGLPELRAAVEEARAAGLPITGHAHGTEGIRRLAAAGFDMVEHCTFMTADGGAESDDDVIAALLDAGMVVSGTLGVVSEPGPRAAELYPQVVEVFRRLRAAGVPIVCSSDAGINANKPHDLLPYSAQMMVELNGFPELEVLRAITSLPADACRIGDRKGRIAPGYDADLLVVAGDPGADIRALREVVAVYQAGRPVG